VDESEIRRGMRVIFLRPGSVFDPDNFLTGKVKGVPNPDLPYVFLIKAEDGERYEVNAHAIIMQAP